MFGCLETNRSCSGVSPLGSFVIMFVSKPCQRLAMRVDRGSGLESNSVSESKCSGESTRRSLRRYIMTF